MFELGDLPWGCAVELSCIGGGRLAAQGRLGKWLQRGRDVVAQVQRNTCEKTAVAGTSEMAGCSLQGIVEGNY